MSKRTGGKAATNRGAQNHDITPAGIAAGTIVLTLHGALPVEYLTPGDRVVTRDGTRVLRGLHVRVARDEPAIRIAASALGHDRPEAEMVVSPEQEILIRDWRAKALYGVETAMVPARRLVDGQYVRRETPEELRLFTLEFDSPAVIYAGDLQLACDRVAAEV
ncbi:Hint domain-containing protein [Acidimangrovimonas pyrenivorans]|uniref:Hint domain-containing protein n=1 Tax=Acidimangrovimonas pyrenivorans TaxID=2030798 RepID=A0ABV7AET5_9RHOB